MKSLSTFLAGAAIGAALCSSFVAFWNPKSTAFVRAAPEMQQLVVHLHRFKLESNKLGEFNEWVQFEHAHHAETVETLEREKMYAEAIFRDPDHDSSTIYWLEIRGADGAATETSPLPVDKVYEKYMRETLVPHSRSTMDAEYVLIPPFLQESIAEHSKGTLPKSGH